MYIDTQYQRSPTVLDNYPHVGSGSMWSRTKCRTLIYLDPIGTLETAFNRLWWLVCSYIDMVIRIMNLLTSRQGCEECNALRSGCRIVNR